MSTTEQSSVYALQVNGTTVEIRPARPSHYDMVKAMHEAMSPDNAYLRFFGLSRTAADAASYEVLDGPGPEPKEAEIAFGVADPIAPQGNRDAVVGAPGLVRQAENTAMLKVIADAGQPVHCQLSGWVVDLTIPLPGLVDGTDMDSYLNAVAEASSASGARWRMGHE